MGVGTPTPTNHTNQKATHTMSTHIPAAPTTPPTKRKRFNIKYAAIGAGAFIIGSLLGAAGQPEPETETVTVTKEVEVPVEKIITEQVEVEVPVTPEACLEALDLSEQGFGLASEAMGYMSDAMTAASTFDIVALEAATAELEVLNPKLTALSDPMNAAKAECRAS